MASEIQEFYKDKTVFITGGTGLVGKLIIEKLLRTCYDLKRIYILVRSKKNKTPTERFQDIFNSPCFNVLKQQRPDFQSKTKLIIGDCSELNLGISDDDWKLLSNEVNCIFHSAANVRFDEPLRSAAKSNVAATQEIVKLAENTINLKVFVYLSTAYSYCVKSHIEERFYQPPIKPETLFALLNDTNDDVLEKVTPHLLGKWPNTYCYTKAISEEVIHQASSRLPIVVIRPSIIFSSINEPIPGWTEQLQGVIGIATGAALGVIKTIWLSGYGISHLVPCDYVANATITTAWDYFQTTNNNNNQSYETKIYNYTMPQDCCLIWPTVASYLKVYAKEYPLLQTMTYPNFEPTTNFTYHKIRRFLWHRCVAYLADFILKILGRKPIAVRKYGQIDKMLELTEFFSGNAWTFDRGNVINMWKQLNDTDKELFKFDMNAINAEQWFKTSFMAGRKLLVKEGPETLEPAKKRLYKLMIIHYCFIAVVMLIVYCLIKLIII